MNYPSYEEYARAFERTENEAYNTRQQYDAATNTYYNIIVPYGLGDEGFYLGSMLTLEGWEREWFEADERPTLDTKESY